MSTNNGQWKPRKVESLPCPSGQVVQIRRPGPEFTLRAGRVVRTFSKVKQEKLEKLPGQSATEFGLDVISKMSDEELAAVLIFARELVCSIMVSPRLVLSPRPNMDEIGPDDIGDDFWFLFNYAMTGFLGLKVPVGDGEVEVDDLASFRGDDSVSGVSVDSSEVRPAS